KVKIGKNCFIGHGVMFINDDFKNDTINKIFIQTNVSNNVLIGSNSTILPVKICSKVIIGAGSVVTKNIDKSGVYAGNPAKFIRKLK
ncbi:MAG: UDP-3-O-(3-hydroxymyristoyl)glucosamine N-acyltransferase, partial [Candidatus Pelagibacter sp.]|nr:UDP-3-O-(3-hydroxymyristoyl)glucosamine N-acyltransferase [Candidatus Pelagibacter sp.]